MNRRDAIKRFTAALAGTLAALPVVGKVFAQSEEKVNSPCGFEVTILPPVKAFNSLPRNEGNWIVDFQNPWLQDSQSLFHRLHTHNGRGWTEFVMFDRAVRPGDFVGFAPSGRARIVRSDENPFAMVEVVGLDSNLAMIRLL